MITALCYLMLAPLYLTVAMLAVVWKITKWLFWGLIVVLGLLI